MYILDNACGLIPNAPIQFMYHLINLIKNLTPVVLIIMGSLDFGKAVMSQKDDEIKKAQGAFIKKLIAGAAVFFVIVFAKWIVQILQNAGVTDSNRAFACVSAILNNSYQADDTPYYEPTNTTNKKDEPIATLEESDKSTLMILINCKNSQDIRDCKNKQNEFCQKVFTDKTCQNFCINDVDFNSPTVADAFSGNHPTGANGCKINNIEEYIQDLPTTVDPNEEPELNTCQPAYNCVCKYEDKEAECKKMLETQQNETLNANNCKNRIDTAISTFKVTYCSNNTPSFDDFVKFYQNSYKKDAFYDALTGDPSIKSFFTNQLAEDTFNCSVQMSNDNIDWVCDVLKDWYE